MGERREEIQGGKRVRDKENRRWKTPEFVLVVVMLGVLTILVFAVLFIPVPDTSAFNTTGSNISDVLDYRKNILAVIVTVFGAWVGAGAAYHFGRENLHEATSSLLQMREPSSKERLRQTPIREMPLKPLDWRVKNSDQVKFVMDKLKGDPQLWFIPVVDDNGKIISIIHEEAIWRFVEAEIKAKKRIPQRKPILRLWRELSRTCLITSRKHPSGANQL